MKTILALCLAVALASAGSTAARPNAVDPCIQPGDTAVHLKTADGATVYGVEVGTGSTGVVLGHQYFSDHCEFMQFARELAGAGYRALTIDFRYNGQSTGGNSSRLDLDVAAAVARLRARRGDAHQARRCVDGWNGGARRRLVDPAARGRGPQPLRPDLLPRPERGPRRQALARSGPLPRRARGAAVCVRRHLPDACGCSEGQGDTARVRRRPRLVDACGAGGEGIRTGIPGPLARRPTVPGRRRRR